ncbi:helix-turn-helix domain-containing protein [Kineosporia babensis]|uniref:XRE family transcriptional regulator n=1 Tax=Kineosporia babensis TaxID=499548 RepID=A0A9X1NIY1_9ACTN|nr:XRE family transcriptional regulator [Kineosporia babensis]MCD5314434.1 XRE family transcriptional regulator [Kineosporia babensis]
MAVDVNTILEGIGPRLHSARKARGRTLKSLAEETGLSVSTLSRLESGLRRPTLDLLIPLAQALHVALDQLVAAPASGDPRIHLEPRHHRQGSVLVPITRYPGRVQVFKQLLGPRERRLTSHPGYEWLYVLAGRLQLVLGEHEYQLAPGELAEFDTAKPHWFGPTGDEAVEILHLFGPFGDQAVNRTSPQP